MIDYAHAGPEKTPRQPKSEGKTTRMKHLHFIGIGGIGMSGLAAWCRALGMKVTGSDRDAGKSENAHILGPLKKQGAVIFPQDGSYAVSGRPDALVYSSAIEEDNPDFAAGGGIPRLHRSKLLAELLASLKTCSGIAVAGSCGKSTVTAYMAEALANCGEDPGFLNGAISKRFVSDDSVGNFHTGAGRYFVFEADESDKSLLNYTPDYAILLNMGTDHYSREELARVFAAFLNRVRKGAVVEREVYESVKTMLANPGLKLRVFDKGPFPGSDCFVSAYGLAENASGQLIPHAVFNGGSQVKLPAPGAHTAANALAVAAMLEMLGFEKTAALKALERFDGIRRRNDLAGLTAAGVPVYDDYAHNPEKISSCLKTLREITRGRIFAVFQPHGFGPLGFFRDELFTVLESVLREGDRFFMLPPFYAGGTSKFKPTSQEVIADWHARSASPERLAFAGDREQLRAGILKESLPGDLIVIMGARDNSLSLYARSFCSSARH